MKLQLRFFAFKNQGKKNILMKLQLRFFAFKNQGKKFFFALLNFFKKK